jgi:hypothetical protein
MSVYFDCRWQQDGGGGLNECILEREKKLSYQTARRKAEDESMLHVNSFSSRLSK